METSEFFVFLFIHLVGLILGFGSVLVTDLLGLLWVFDRVRFPHLVRISGRTEKFIWAGWSILVAAGIPLVYLKGTIDNLMIIKLFFVVLIGINGIFLHRFHKKLERYREGDDVPNLTMFRLSLSLSISQLGWWGALVIGFLHRHVRTIIDWPAHPWFVSLIILASISLIWAVGEVTFKINKKNG